MSARHYDTHKGLRRAVDAGEIHKSPRLLPHGYLRSIPCPDCAAELGGPCVSITSKALSTPHISRRRLAIRKYRAEQEEQ